MGATPKENPKNALKKIVLMYMIMPYAITPLSLAKRNSCIL